jgi:hypothetical protein
LAATVQVVFLRLPIKDSGGTLVLKKNLSVSLLSGYKLNNNNWLGNSSFPLCVNISVNSLKMKLESLSFSDRFRILLEKRPSGVAGLRYIMVYGKCQLEEQILPDAKSVIAYIDKQHGVRYPISGAKQLI